MIQFSTDLFSHHADTKTFVVELSTLSRGQENLQVFDRVPFNCTNYPGFELVSSKTGLAAPFILSGCKRDKEDELQSYTLSLLPGMAKKFPNLKGYTIIIFND